MPLRHGETTGDGFPQDGAELHRGAHHQPPREAAAWTGATTDHEVDGAAAANGCRTGRNLSETLYARQVKQ
jgi:hypothetical protein